MTGYPQNIVSTAATSLTSSGYNEWHFSDLDRYSNTLDVNTTSYGTTPSLFYFLSQSIRDSEQVLVRMWDFAEPSQSLYFINSGSADITNRIGVGPGDFTLQLKWIGGPNFNAAVSVPPVDNFGSNACVSFELLSSTSNTSDTNIYNTDGVLTTDRTVDYNGKNLIFLDSTGSLTQFNLHSGSIFTLSGSSQVNIRNLASSTQSNILYYNTTTGRLTYGAPPADTNTNIYNLNGTLTGNREVRYGAYNLTFEYNTGTPSSTLFQMRNNPGDSFTISGSKEVYIKDLANTIKDNIVYYDPANGLLTYGVPTSGSSGSINLYTSDGTLTDNRIVTYNGNNLTFDASGAAGDTTFKLSSTSSFEISGSSQVNIRNLASSTQSNLLYYNTSTGRLTYGAPPIADIKDKTYIQINSGYIPNIKDGRNYIGNEYEGWNGGAWEINDTTYTGSVLSVGDINCFAPITMYLSESVDYEFKMCLNAFYNGDLADIDLEEVKVELYYIKCDDFFVNGITPIPAGHATSTPSFKTNFNSIGAVCMNITGSTALDTSGGVQPCEIYIGVGISCTKGPGEGDSLKFSYNLSIEEV